MNDEHRNILASHPWPFMEGTATDSTVASQQAYDLPGDLGKLINVTITVSSIVHSPQEAPNRDFWNRINESSVTSDIPEYYYIYGNNIEFYPKPSSASNTITYYYKKRVRNLSVADYTTGTISTIANSGGVTTITGASTVWTAAVVGKYIKITHSDIAKSGDGIWYKIKTRTADTSITLDGLYQGDALATATTGYTIGDMPQLPEDFQNIILWRPLAQYWMANDQERRAKMYEDRFAVDYKLMKAQFGYKTDSVVVGDTQVEITNPNLQISI